MKATEITIPKEAIDNRKSPLVGGTYQEYAVEVGGNGIEGKLDIQCKNQNLTEEEINELIKEAEKFRKDDENGPQKIITMTEFPDRIDCLLNADIDGLLVQFNGVVNNYGDFKKVIRLFARCLETSGAKDQSDDLLTVADAL